MHILGVYIYIYIYMYVCVYMYIYIYTYTFITLSLSLSVYIGVQKYIQCHAWLQVERLKSMLSEAKPKLEVQALSLHTS